MLLQQIADLTVESVHMYGVACFAHHGGNYKIMPSGWPVVITEEVAYNLWLICDVCECFCDCVEAKKHC